MKIKKLGHCCLYIQTNGVTILTDPGTYSTLQNEAMGIDIILITHEHSDHFHIESLKQVIVNNPKAKIITNTAVSKLLEAEKIISTVLEEEQSVIEQGIVLAGYGNVHEYIYTGWNDVQNTGYFIAD